MSCSFAWSDFYWLFCCLFLWDLIVCWRIIVRVVFLCFNFLYDRLFVLWGVEITVFFKLVLFVALCVSGLIEFYYLFLIPDFKGVNGLFLIIKPTRCTNFLNLFLEWNSTCFGQFPCPSSEVFRCTHSNGICHTGSLTVCEQDQDGTHGTMEQKWNAVPSWSCSQAVSKPAWHIPLLCVQWKTPDDGQRNCPKHVEFHSKNKFEKLMHLVGFIIRNSTRCTVIWTSKLMVYVSNSFISINKLPGVRSAHRER